MLLVWIIIPGSFVHGLSILSISGISNLINLEYPIEGFLRELLRQSLMTSGLRLSTRTRIHPRVALQRKVGSVIISSIISCLVVVILSNCVGCLHIHPGILQVSLAVCLAVVLIVHLISCELGGREVLVAGPVVLELLEGCWVLVLVILSISFLIFSWLALVSSRVCICISIEGALTT